LPSINPNPPDSIQIEERPGKLLAVMFHAMASPCELLVHGTDRQAALELGGSAAAEVWRIEKKYSRYRDDSVVASIHQHRGRSVRVDDETAALLEFARQCFDISEGLFDITSGVLRMAWKFDGGEGTPKPEVLAPLLPLIGFEKLQWNNPWLSVPPGMELDFGGIGKEYAVDRVYDLLMAQSPTPFLINLGGDLRANRPLPQGPWKVGIERPDLERTAALTLDLEYGALATSGDTHRFVLKDGVRFGHILNPRTGWPMAHAPRSVTVAASSCTEAGLIATLAMLKVAASRQFLKEQGVLYWLLQ